MRFTYSYRPPGQDDVDIDAEALLESLAEDLIASGDLEAALRRRLRYGVEGDHFLSPGLDHLLKSVRSRRCDKLDSYDVAAQLNDLAREIRADAHWDVSALRGDAFDSGAVPVAETRQATDTDVKQKREFLECLPNHTFGRLDQPENDDSRKHVTTNGHEQRDNEVHEDSVPGYRQTAGQGGDRSTSEELDRLSAMLEDMNDMLEGHSSSQVRFDRFMKDHAQFFPGVASPHDMITRLQQNIDRLAVLFALFRPRGSDGVEDQIRFSLSHSGLNRELARAQRNVQRLSHSSVSRLEGSLTPGDQNATLDADSQLWPHFQDLDELERQLELAIDEGSAKSVSSDLVRRLLGQSAAHDLDRLKVLAQTLAVAGYAAQGEHGVALTPRGMRRVGEKCLRDIFVRVRQDGPGRHQTRRRGTGSEYGDFTRPYDYGDDFIPDMSRSLLNAIAREGAGVPLRVSLTDFEVVASERQTCCATVLLLDLSRSMPLRGCFMAAKKVALALNSMIRMQFPSDKLFIVGFSEYAREIQPETLLGLSLGPSGYGTNMQHGFMLARKLLSRHHHATKQIILITDGEPTAHFEGKKVHFSYPPAARTFKETLREVQRCSREHIIINTFMLDRSHFLTEFVNEVARVNGGRAFFTSPKSLGDYVLVDYANTKQSGRQHGGVARFGFRH